MTRCGAGWFFPSDYRNPTPAARYHLTVIGAGPAGPRHRDRRGGSGRASRAGGAACHGGDCLNVGCVPSKTLLAAVRGGLTFALAMQRVRAVRAHIARHDSVERYTQAESTCSSGRGVSAMRMRFASQRRRLRTRRTVIAHRGARPHSAAARTCADHTLEQRDRVRSNRAATASGGARRRSGWLRARAGLRAPRYAGRAARAWVPSPCRRTNPRRRSGWLTPWSGTASGCASARGSRAPRARSRQGADARGRHVGCRR